MSYAESLLAREERIVRVARRHWITVLPTFLLDGTAIIVISGLAAAGAIWFHRMAAFGFVLLLAPIGHLIVRISEWRSAQTIITNRRIIQITGLFEKNVSDTLIEKVNDIVTRQSWWGRILNFGDLELITGSDVGTDLCLSIADPVGLKKDLLDQRPVHTDSEDEEELHERRDDAYAIAAEEIPDLIRELAELRDKGLLTAAEFDSKKQQLLNRM